MNSIFLPLQCVSKRGYAVTFVGGSSAVVAAAGSCSMGNISLWDITSRPQDACIGRLKHHKDDVCCIHTLPGGWLLAAGDNEGRLSVTDVRMMGSSSSNASVLWAVRAAKGRITSLDVLQSCNLERKSGSLLMGAASGYGSGVVTAGVDGIIRIWEANSGKLLQETDPIFTNFQKANRLLSLTSHDPKHLISDIEICEEGILASGTDGVVRLFPRL